MLTEYKVYSIADFNSFLDNEYKNLNPRNENWYPIMYYDENIDLKKKRYMTVGINPSLTVKAKKYINKQIFDIKDYNDDYKKKVDEVDEYGELRYKKFWNSNIKYQKKLIDFQNLLKSDKKAENIYYNTFPINYFKKLEEFFKAIGKDFKQDVFHYDFCQLRETDSISIREWLSKNNFSNFIQLLIHLDKIVELIQPEYVFIFNASLVEMLMENKFFHCCNPKALYGKDLFQFYNGFMNYDGVCTRKDTKFIIGNQLSGGATSRVYRANLIANVNRLMNK